MPRITNTNPTGDVWSPLTGFVAAGDTVDVTDDIASQLLEQVGNWSLAKPSKKES